MKELLQYLIVYGSIIIWYTRVIEGAKYYVQLSSWTTPSREAENKQELLNNLSSFDWVVQEKK